MEISREQFYSHLDAMNTSHRHQRRDSFHRPVFPRNDANLPPSDAFPHAEIQDQYTGLYMDASIKSYHTAQATRSSRPESDQPTSSTRHQRRSHSRSLRLSKGAVAPELAYLLDATPPSTESSGSTTRHLAQILPPIPVAAMNRKDDREGVPVWKSRNPQTKVDIRDLEIFFPPEMQYVERITTEVSPERVRGNGFERERLRCGTPWPREEEEWLLSEETDEEDDVYAANGDAVGEKESGYEGEDEFFDAEEGLQILVPGRWPSSPPPQSSTDTRRSPLASRKSPSPAMVEDYYRGASDSIVPLPLKISKKALANRKISIHPRTPSPFPASTLYESPRPDPATTYNSPVIYEEDINDELIAHWNSNPYVASNLPHGHYFRDMPQVPPQPAMHSYHSPPSPMSSLSGTYYPTVTRYIPSPSHSHRLSLPQGTSFSDLHPYTISPPNSPHPHTPGPPSTGTGHFNRAAGVGFLRTSRGREFVIRDPPHRRVRDSTEAVSEGDSGGEEMRVLEKMNRFVERGRELLDRCGVRIDSVSNPGETRMKEREYAEKIESVGKMHAGNTQYSTKNMVARSASMRLTPSEEAIRLPTPLSIFYPGIIRGITPLPTPPQGYSMLGSEASWSTFSGSAETLSDAIYPMANVPHQVETADDTASSCFRIFEGDHRTRIEAEADVKRTGWKNKVWWKAYHAEKYHAEKPSVRQEPGEEAGTTVPADEEEPASGQPHPTSSPVKSCEMVENKDSPDYGLLTRTLMKAYLNVHQMTDSVPAHLTALHSDLQIAHAKLRTTTLPRLRKHLKSTSRTLRTTHLPTITKPLKYLAARPKILFKRFTNHPRALAHLRARSQRSRSTTDVVSAEVGEQLVRHASGKERGMTRAGDRAMRMSQRWRGLRRRVRGRVGRLLGRRREEKEE
ncbi:hypothetical protein P280DRAFT_476143 [Massarina eburnea CBS 473.64]|uniref:Uncharacterized protein n=1 Tax=Massarina eburnea CBS 473.64 TaxID=1395130 RepID=A0A6A6SCX1_9PLEO|nr:hypothetical protein P280DRAFT_476143 [Massarina eburnea CBS 473.64]